MRRTPRLLSGSGRRLSRSQTRSRTSLRRSERPRPRRRLRPSVRPLSTRPKRPRARRGARSKSPVSNKHATRGRGWIGPPWLCGCPKNRGAPARVQSPLLEATPLPRFRPQAQTSTGPTGKKRQGLRDAPSRKTKSKIPLLPKRRRASSPRPRLPQPRRMTLRLPTLDEGRRGRASRHPPRPHVGRVARRRPCLSEATPRPCPSRRSLSRRG